MTRKTKSISLALISSSLILAGCTGSSSSGHHRSHVGGRAFVPIPIPVGGGSSGVSSSSHSGGFGSSGHSSGS